MVILGRLSKKSEPKREMEMVRDYRMRIQCHLMGTKAKRRISKKEGDQCWQMKQAESCENECEHCVGLKRSFPPRSNQTRPTACFCA